MAIRYAFAVEV